MKHQYPTVKQYRISSKFGTRIHPISKKESYHNGVDIACPTGTALKNTVSTAICTKVGFDNRNGHYLRLEHDNGLLTSYAHLSKVIAKEGAEIDLGEVFALTGNTGASTGAHLHFRVRELVNGVYIDVNPEDYFAYDSPL